MTKLNLQDISLPVSEIIPEIRSCLRNRNTLIISAPPGAGKSTLLPLSLLEEEWLGGQKILMLEPRRLAARSIASRMCEMIGEKPGETIGYRVRFENRISENTRLEVITEGILTRMMQDDNMLEGVGMVIFDEFHERNLHADIALALCREVQEIIRPDLRIVIMSATLDTKGIAQLIQAPVIESKGKSYPVEIRYKERNERFTISEQVVSVVMKALCEKEGDVLVFLPGEREIRNCEEMLLSRIHDDVVIYPLYGMLEMDKQRKAILPDVNGRRKIVLSTSIAETSLTIEGIRIVIDSGFYRRQKYDPKTELTRLETLSVSKDMADQRAGRAGRLSSGICYRLWGKTVDGLLVEHRIPEIEEADLTSLVLDMAAWGTSEIEKMTWLTIPPMQSLKRAATLLEVMKVLEDGKITPYGKEIHKIGCHPRIAHMLLRGKQIGETSLAADIAALLEERDPFGAGGDSDLCKRIDALRRFRQDSCGMPPAFKSIIKSAFLYSRMLGVKVDNAGTDVWKVGYLLSMAYPERIAKALGNGLFQLSNGKRARIDISDDLAHEEWLSIAQMDDRDGIGKIFMAAPVHFDDLLSSAEERDFINWETRNGGIIARHEWRIGQLILKTQPLRNIDKGFISELLCTVVKNEGEQLLDFNEEVIMWQSRISSLRIWCPEYDWPDVSITNLLQTCEKWLTPYLENIRKTEDFKRIDLKEILRFYLPYELQLLSDELAPEKITVPTGSRISLKYFPDGSQPVLAVRLQECFGLVNTPAVCNGKIPVLLHLLSPGFKPVQITSDLRSFWQNTYFDVKKELKRRYPKHVWPEDPIKEKPVRGTKRKQ